MSLNVSKIKVCSVKNFNETFSVEKVHIGLVVKYCVFEV